MVRRCSSVTAGNRWITSAGGPSREDGDAVVGLLTREHRVVAGAAKLFDREPIVGELRLLEHEHVGTMLVQPVEDMRQPHVE